MAGIELGFTGNPKVIEQFKRKKKLLAIGDPKQSEIDATLMFTQGGSAGAYEAGIAKALIDLGYYQVPDKVVGVSTGAPVAWYFGAGDIKGVPIYHQNNIENELVKFSRFPNIFGIRRLAEVFRDDLPIDEETIQNSRSDFYIGVTGYADGIGRMKSLKGRKNPLGLMVASLCVPFIGDGGVKVDGIKSCDGGVAFPLPISYAVIVLKSKNILIAMTEPPVYKYSSDRAISVVDSLEKIGLVKPLVAAMARNAQVFNSELDFITGRRPLPEDVNLGIIHPLNTSVGMFCMDQNDLKEATIQGELFTKYLFS